MVTLAERIDLLFREFRRPDGREYSYHEVEVGTGKAVTGAYVWKLRTGLAENPGYRVLKALSNFFDVPITYFFDDEPSPEYGEALRLASKLRQSGVAHIALRAGDLDERGQRAVLDLIEYVRKAQGLDSAVDEGPEDA